jgi:hypothetical protein
VSSIRNHVFELYTERAFIVGHAANTLEKRKKHFFTHLIQLDQNMKSNTDIYEILDLINRNYCLSTATFSTTSQKEKGKTIITLEVQALKTKTILEKNLLITCTHHETKNLTSVWHNKLGSSNETHFAPS